MRRGGTQAVPVASSQQAELPAEADDTGDERMSVSAQLRLRGEIVYICTQVAAFASSTHNPEVCT